MDFIVGIGFTLSAGLMLGLYALPQKYATDFKESNIWGMFFLLAMVVVPLVSSFTMIKGAATIYSDFIASDVFIHLALASFLWGVGMVMWGKAIHHIGLSLGFSIFIGTAILVGSLIGLFSGGLPETQKLILMLLGLFFVLLGIFANGKAGMLREASGSEEQSEEKGSMAAGIAIAVVGGILVAGFNYANTVGTPSLKAATVANGNPEWMGALAVMSLIYLSGAIVTVVYSVWQLNANKTWAAFKTPALTKNTGLILIMAVFNFGASGLFAYGALKLGSEGGSIGYAIFNTVSVVAAVTGIVTGEWKDAQSKAKTQRFNFGLLSMVVGILVIAVS